MKKLFFILPAVIILYTSQTEAVYHTSFPTVMTYDEQRYVFVKLLQRVRKKSAHQIYHHIPVGPRMIQHSNHNQFLLAGCAALVPLCYLLYTHCSSLCHNQN